MIVGSDCRERLQRSMVLRISCAGFVERSQPAHAQSAYRCARSLHTRRLHTPVCAQPSHNCNQCCTRMAWRTCMRGQLHPTCASAHPDGHRHKMHYMSDHACADALHPISAHCARTLFNSYDTGETLIIRTNTQNTRTDTDYLTDRWALRSPSCVFLFAGLFCLCMDT